VYEVLQKRNFGNWSDMGTGKTLAAILSAYIVGAKVSLICCPNSVKEEWRVHILGVFPRANIIESIKKVNIQIRLNK
jgi:N12 class adenine-specific DNA methylase